MTRDYSILVDNWADEKWVMTGRDVMLSVLRDENSIQHKELIKEGRESDIKELIHRKGMSTFRYAAMPIHWISIRAGKR